MTEDRNGGLYVYEISINDNDKKMYIVSNPDQIRELLSNPPANLEALLPNTSTLNGIEDVRIRRLGKASLNNLTLWRLVSDYQREHTS